MKFTYEPESRPLAGFTIKRAIYRGGFGEVYYGLTDAGREVALKLLQNNPEIELRGVQQCLNLSHPNLVTIFDVKTDPDGDHWIVMEYISGETLDAAIRRHPQGMPLEMVRRWLPGIVAGTGFLHSRGLVHRDLKPANIFQENGTVKIGDVGLSKFITPSRRSAQTQSVGTVYYMAPEIAKGRYGKEVDIYALAVILFEMLTGQVPFDGESTGEILMKHLTQLPDLNRLPPRLRQVIGKALSKEPTARYSSMDAFLHAFEDAVLGRATQEFEPAAAERPLMPEWSPEETSQRPFGSPLKQLEVLTSEPFWKGSLSRVVRFTTLMLAVIFLLTLITPSEGAWYPGIWVLALALPLVLMLTIPLAMFSSYRQWSQSGIARGTIPPVAAPAAPPLPQSSPVTDRLAGYLGSAFIAAPFTILFTAIFLFLKRTAFLAGNGLEQIDAGAVGLFATTALIGSWGALAVPCLATLFGKNASRSRLNFAGIGLLTGTSAGVIGEYLLVELSNLAQMSPGKLRMVGDIPLSVRDHGPTLAGFAVFFGLLFLLNDWWKLVDPARPQRFSAGLVFKSVLFAWLTTLVVPFPVVWALGWAAVIACTTQLASPWNGENAPRLQAARGHAKWKKKHHCCNW